jgi:hypothetical protein
MIDQLYINEYSDYNLLRFSLLKQFPRTTDFDYHIHVYICGAKYKIRQLRDAAIQKYEHLVHSMMGMDFSSSPELVRPVQPVPAYFSAEFNRQEIFGVEVRTPVERPLFTIYEDETATPASAVPASPPPSPTDDDMLYTPLDPTLPARMYHFISSITLLWKRTTSSPNDEMRIAVLEVVKEYLHKLVKVRDFKTLVVGHREFAEDLKKSCAEDGLKLIVKDRRVVVGGAEGLAFGAARMGSLERMRDLEVQRREGGLEL